MSRCCNQPPTSCAVLLGRHCRQQLRGRCVDAPDCLRSRIYEAEKRHVLYNCRKLEGYQRLPISTCTGPTLRLQSGNSGAPTAPKRISVLHTTDCMPSRADGTCGAYAKPLHILILTCTLLACNSLAHFVWCVNRLQGEVGGGGEGELLCCKNWFKGAR